jgi:UDP-glucose 4-epimerase
MSKYLVTGGCGFIGSHLVQALLNEGHAVRVLDNLSTGEAAFTSPAVEFILGDVADPRLMADAIDGTDGCFHLAAVASVERCNTDWLGSHRTNSTGAVTVFSGARATARRAAVPVVFASSAAVYGDGSIGRISERSPVRPLSPYGVDKLSCELNGFVASRLYQVPTCGLRFFNVYGPGQDPNSPYSGVISIFCTRLKAGQQVTIYGDGQQTRDFIYVGDVVRALLVAMNRCTLGGEIFNVCTGVATTVVDLALLIGQVLGKKPKIVFGPPRDGEVRHSVGDPDTAHRAMEFSASIDLTGGLALTLGSLGMVGEIVDA